MLNTHLITTYSLAYWVLCFLAMEVLINIFPRVCIDKKGCWCDLSVIKYRGSDYTVAVCYFMWRLVCGLWCKKKWSRMLHGDFPQVHVISFVKCLEC